METNITYDEKGARVTLALALPTAGAYRAAQALRDAPFYADFRAMGYGNVYDPESVTDTAGADEIAIRALALAVAAALRVSCAGIEKAYSAADPGGVP